MKASRSSQHHFMLHSVQLCGCRNNKELIELGCVGLITAAYSVPPFHSPTHGNISYVFPRQEQQACCSEIWVILTE